MYKVSYALPCLVSFSLQELYVCYCDILHSKLIPHRTSVQLNMSLKSIGYNFYKFAYIQQVNSAYKLFSELYGSKCPDDHNLQYGLFGD